MRPSAEELMPCGQHHVLPEILILFYQGEGSGIKLREGGKISGSQHEANSMYWVWWDSWSNFESIQ